MASGNRKRIGRELPRCLRGLFWEYRFQSLRWEQDRDLIIGRILAAGDWNATTWLRRQLGDHNLRTWIVARQGRGLSPRQLRFWELVLGLPRRQVNGWLAHVQRMTWDRRTN